MLTMNEHGEFADHSDEDAESRRREVYAGLLAVDTGRMRREAEARTGRKDRCDVCGGEVPEGRHRYCCRECAKVGNKVETMRRRALSGKTR